MESYRLEIKRSAAKELERLPDRDRQSIVQQILALADDARPSGCEKLSAHVRYRVRQGPYRILYETDDSADLVTVVRIGHGRDIYR